ncbi:membrane bound o-acyl transferase family domain-containing protein [Zalerion maritima]|uniref:Membrane bound o-acyl transferase family domain-containing protein n=1 Tax=Zalerion maritima TaxID=339359 RepID=A0AAD5WUU6_9PEZI|nr:membrane bound o-acyl transferase family domain-containing protein [Zalerion maritima]
MPPVTLPSVCALEPVLWFLLSLPVFVYTIHQKPHSRWPLLPLNIVPPIQCYRTVNRLNDTAPGLDWLWAFTSLIYILHSTSALYVQQWTLSESDQKARSDWNLHAACRAWLNARRLPRKSISPVAITLGERIRFTGRKIFLLLFLALLYMSSEIFILLVLDPQPEDFQPVQRSHFHFRPDRAAVVRALFALQWAWLTCLILTVANSLVAVFFVAIIKLDAPEEWTPLFGNPLEAYSLRRFWGIFWHKLGSPAQVEYGRLLADRILGLRPGGGAEKTFIALWVFVVSGLVHGLVAWKTEPEQDARPWGDMKFLLVNFIGGLAEVIVARGVSLMRSNGGRVSPEGKMLGFLWVFLFFYCTVPEYQYPTLQRTAEMRAPMMRVRSL